MEMPTSKAACDQFFTERGSEDTFEGQYADLAELGEPLLSHFPPAIDSDSVQILVPGCGSSRLSELVYDAGFRHIINVDFSHAVVLNMLRRYRSRPEMKWRAHDITDLKYPERVFDIVLDKGTLDSLVEPEVVLQYIKQVKRVLKNGGKFICLTWAHPEVLGLLLSAFRFGWEMTIQVIPNNPTKKSDFETFMVVIKKVKFGSPTSISLLEDSRVSFSTEQVDSVACAIQLENNTRDQYSSDKDVIFTLKDLGLGANGELKEPIPGQRFRLFLGEKGSSLCYKAVLLDAKPQIEPFEHQCAVFIVPKLMNGYFFSEVGQWRVVKNLRAARVFMVFLDSRHMPVNMKHIESELSPLVEELAPDKLEDESPIKFREADDDVKQRNLVHKAESEITGPVIVEDVVYVSLEDEEDTSSVTKGQMYRRLVFERNAGMVQSEAFLVREGKTDQDEKDIPSISRKKGSRKKGNKKYNLSKSAESKSNFKIDHTRLASMYHTGILAGFSLIASSVKTALEAGEKVQVVIVGLGAGLLPMFLHDQFPLLEIEVVELDHLVVELAKKYFGFMVDQRMKVRIGDGVKYVKESTERENSCSTDPLSSGTSNKETRILVIDADSAEPSSTLLCPDPNFMEELFLKSAKAFISHGGLFITNLVPRSPAIREAVISRMEVVFDHLFLLQLEDEVNEVLYACTNKTKNEKENSTDLEKLVKLPVEVAKEVASCSSRIQRLK